MAKGTWDPEVESLKKRFRSLAPAKEGFELRSGVTVIDPVKFHEALAGEIEGGPRGARARIGALQTDLREYIQIREGRSSVETKTLHGKEGP